MTTATAYEWEKAAIEAPDASYQMAKAHFNPESGLLTVRNRTDAVVATYQLDTHDILKNTLTGNGPDGDVSVRVDSRCSCVGYKRRAR